MANPTGPEGEHPSTYLVQDRSSQDEFERVRIQGELVTASMGGPLPEQPRPETIHSVLDVGCGAGDWLLEVAATYPNVTTLVGIDISSKMLTYARTRAEAHQIGKRVDFQVMDALRMLEFPSNTFELVNMRFVSSFLRKWDWAKLLQEVIRVSRPKGIIRITEGQVIQEGNSPALLQLGQLLLQATQQAGHTFSQEGNGVTEELIELLTRHGLRQVQTRPYTLIYRFGTPAWQAYYDDTVRASRTFLPFLRKWISVPDNYEELCQQAFAEMRQPDFVGSWKVLTVWGIAPPA